MFQWLLAKQVKYSETKSTNGIVLLVGTNAKQKIWHQSQKGDFITIEPILEAACSLPEHITECQGKKLPNRHTRPYRRIRCRPLNQAGSYILATLVFRRPSTLAGSTLWDVDADAPEVCSSSPISPGMMVKRCTKSSLRKTSPQESTVERLKFLSLWFSRHALPAYSQGAAILMRSARDKVRLRCCNALSGDWTGLVF